MTDLTRRLTTPSHPKETIYYYHREVTHKKDTSLASLHVLGLPPHPILPQKPFDPICYYTIYYNSSRRPSFPSPVLMQILLLLLTKLQNCLSRLWGSADGLLLLSFLLFALSVFFPSFCITPLKTEAEEGEGPPATTITPHERGGHDDGRRRQRERDHQRGLLLSFHFSSCCCCPFSRSGERRIRAKGDSCDLVSCGFLFPSFSFALFSSQGAYLYYTLLCITTTVLSVRT